jgi:hypothetical protein
LLPIIQTVENVGKKVLGRIFWEIGKFIIKK